MPWMVIFIAAAWVALTGTLDPWNIALGVALAMLCLYFSGTRMGGKSVGLRAVARVVGLALYLLRELVMATAQVAVLVLRPRMRLRPGIVAVPLDVERDWQITLLAQMITLTPGTLALDLSEDRRTLFVHFLDLKDVERAKRDIKQGFERRILELAP